mmetsp:Transcript_1845/g.5832  ORF Transcript_1845/g.5832 Transcript_1845/m.5832 type:complete len:288 (-) Transcript_1845:475-1338(-)
MGRVGLCAAGPARALCAELALDGALPTGAARDRRRQATRVRLAHIRVLPSGLAQVGRPVSIAVRPRNHQHALRHMRVGVVCASVPPRAIGASRVAAVGVLGRGALAPRWTERRLRSSNRQAIWLRGRPLTAYAHPSGGAPPDVPVIVPPAGAAGVAPVDGVAARLESGAAVPRRSWSARVPRVEAVAREPAAAARALGTGPRAARPTLCADLALDGALPVGAPRDRARRDAALEEPPPAVRNACRIESRVGRRDERFRHGGVICVQRGAGDVARANLAPLSIAHEES